MIPQRFRWLAGVASTLALVLAIGRLYSFYLANEKAQALDRFRLAEHPRNTQRDFRSKEFQQRHPAEIRPFIQLFEQDDQLFATALASIEANWRPTYAIMLLELISNGLELRRTDQIHALLERKTGHKSKDFNDWYLWVWENVPDTHPHYPEFKAFVYSYFDVRFVDYFPAGVPHSIRLEEIRWGGVAQNGIPPLVYPKSVPAAAATYLHDGDRVFGVYHDGQARAYPQRILGWHELARDRLGATNITAVYCPLCQAMIVYRSQVGTRTFTLGTSGFLYRSSKLMFDAETNSLWSTFAGKPVVGPLVGQVELASLPVVSTTWGAWRKLHPNTTVLARETGHTRDYEEGVAYSDYFATPRIWYTVPQVNPALPAKSEVLCLRDPAAPETRVGFDTRFLQRQPFHHDKVGNLAVVILTDQSGAARVYACGEQQFASWDGSAQLIDQAGAAWQVSEEALVKDKLRLPRLPAHRAFWFAWHAAYPEARLVK